MARKRTSAFEDIIAIIAKLPWWIGVVLALIFYVWLHHVATQPASTSPADVKQMGAFVGEQIWHTLATILQYILPACSLIGAGISAYKKFLQGNQSSRFTPTKETSDVGFGRERGQLSTEGNSSTPNCDMCGAAMVKRVAKKGANAGEAFWGCTKFPQCRGTRAIG